MTDGGSVDSSDKPTVFTKKDLDKVFKDILNSELKEMTCSSCDKSFYLDSYGEAFGECDECFFKRVPEEKRIEFFRSFLK